jgi:hypothetical protein
MAKIEVRSHDIETLSKFYSSTVDNFPELNRPQHLFIILTKGNGKQRVLRGGPGEDGKIYVEEAAYEILPDQPLPPDWPTAGINHYKVGIFEGNEQQAIYIYEAMWRRGQEINAGDDLTDPLYRPECAFSDGIGYNYNFWTQNSNTVITELLAAGEQAASEIGLAELFQEKLLPQINGQAVFAPGIFADLSHLVLPAGSRGSAAKAIANMFRNSYQVFEHFLQEHNQKLTEFINQLAQSTKTDKAECWAQLKETHLMEEAPISELKNKYDVEELAQVLPPKKLKPYCSAAEWQSLGFDNN